MKFVNKKSFEEKKLQNVTKRGISREHMAIFAT